MRYSKTPCLLIRIDIYKVYNTCTAETHRQMTRGITVISEGYCNTVSCTSVIPILQYWTDRKM